jgi:alpha-glucosidase
MTGLELGLFALPVDGDAFAVRAGPRVVRVRLRHAPDGEEELLDLKREGPLFVGGPWPHVQRRYRYLVDLDNGDRLALHAAGVSDHEPLDAFDLARTPLGPSWAPQQAFYLAFVDRFAQGDPSLAAPDGAPSLRGLTVRRRPWDAPPLSWAEARSLDFHGGDLVGVREKLDHVRALGCTGLYLTPIHPAFTCHRYDVQDFEAVDPHLGGEAALAALTGAAHDRGMKVVLDAVINHVGSGHRWFNREGQYAEPGAWQAPEGPEADHFFIPDGDPSRALLWKGVDTLPRLNFASKRLRERLWGPAGALRKWLRAPYGVDGYRFDCANMVGRAGATQLGREVWTELAAALAPEAPWLVGEHWFDPGDSVGPGRLHGGMDYLGFTFPVRRFFTGIDRDGTRGNLSGEGLLAQLSEAHAASGGATHLVCVNSHDVPRLQSEAGWPSFIAASALQAFWPGVPCVYYGDEVGLEGGAEPDNRRAMQWDRRKWVPGVFEALQQGLDMRTRSEALKRGVLAPLGAGRDWAAWARVGRDEIAIAIVARDACRATLDLRGLGLGAIDAEFDGPGAAVQALPAPHAR